MMNLEERLRQAARDSGLSVLQLATRSGIHYMSAHSFVTGKRTLTLTTAAKLAEALDLELVPKRRRKGG